MENRKMNPVDLSVCETLLEAAYDQESAQRITQPLKDIYEKMPGEVGHYKVALEKIYLEVARANKLNEWQQKFDEWSLCFKFLSKALFFFSYGHPTASHRWNLLLFAT